MDTELFAQLAACSTSNSWSTLEAVACKVSKRAGRKVTPRELDALMVSVGDAGLLSHGIWRTSFGKKYMPIVVVNTAFARACARTGGVVHVCTCQVMGPPKPGAAAGSACETSKAEKDMERYYGSTDYNAGRHASTASVHKGQCLMWRPPTSGHLHSWRRGFT